MSYVTHLRCVNCDQEYAQGGPLTCPKCGPARGILDVGYDMPRVAEHLTRAALASRTRSHWRYRELLPLDEPFCPSEGVIGWTPMIDVPRLAEALGIWRL